VCIKAKVTEEEEQFALEPPEQHPPVTEPPAAPEEEPSAANGETEEVDGTCGASPQEERIPVEPAPPPPPGAQVGFVSICHQRGASPQISGFGLLVC